MSMTSSINTAAMVELNKENRNSRHKFRVIVKKMCELCSVSHFLVEELRKHGTNSAADPEGSMGPTLEPRRGPLCS